MQRHPGMAARNCQTRLINALINLAVDWRDLLLSHYAWVLDPLGKRVFLMGKEFRLYEPYKKCVFVHRWCHYTKEFLEKRGKRVFLMTRSNLRVQILDPLGKRVFLETRSTPDRL